ncbi:MAG: hypothetical protein HY287_04385 [Planctomycetes bacterium]|nr:hypothetical protein [Planctomycetota bacterium]MBI3833552.1 hypothetical protein [Planctomycetota bacterium]
MQQQRPAKEIIPPESLRQREIQQPEAHKLAPESFPSVDHYGSILPSGAMWVFQDRDAPAVKYKLLPNAALEVAVHTNDAGRDPITYKVSGEFTVFENENFLLLRSVMRASRGTPDESEKSAGANPDSKGTPTSAPNAGNSPSRPDESAEDVLRRMHELEPVAGIVSSPSANSREARGSAGGRGLLLDGSFVASRPGRLIKQDDWWILNPEPAHSDTIDASLRVLPGRGLETMTQAARKSSNNQVFIVSGEVTLFEGQNYLLPRSVIRRINYENLQP